MNRSKAPSIAELELMAVSDDMLFEHCMKQIGLPVVGQLNDDPTEKAVQSESISSIASTITEDTNENIRLDPYRAQVKQMAERLGYIVTIS